MKEQIITDFSDYQEPDLIRAAMIIKDAMKGNAYFRGLTEKTRVVETAYFSFVESILLAVHGGKEAAGRKETAHRTLVRALGLLSVGINLEADGNLILLLSTGYPLAGHQ